MTKQNSISVYVREKEEEIIQKASEIVSLPASAFCRTFAVQKAKEIIKEAENGRTE